MGTDYKFMSEDSTDKKMSFLEILSLKSVQDLQSDDPCDKLVEKEVILSTLDDFVTDRMAVVEKALDEKQAVLFAEQFNTHRNTMSAIFKDRESRAQSYRNELDALNAKVDKLQQELGLNKRRQYAA